MRVLPEYFLHCNEARMEKKFCCLPPFASLGVIRCFLICSFLAAAISTLPAEVQPVGEAFVYKKAGDREMKLFVSKPSDWKSTDQRPAIVFFHGGGWVAGAPSQFNDHCK